MTQYLIIPGLGNSGPEHWQTYFESESDQCKRILQNEWDAPDCSEWIRNIQQTLEAYDPNDVVLIGHSLGCATIAHWAAKYQIRIKGAMLVAPSDLEAPAYQFPATGFAPIPLNTLPFRSIVVASEDDPWVSLERAKFFAGHWGSEFVNIGKAGHINAASGHFRWDEGLAILKTLG
ncbi:MAG: alpha/beta hydrolase [Bacteroidota bacterium]|nr:alpha/beta hydrolase [Bacteroidota bacterium]